MNATNFNKAIAEINNLILLFRLRKRFSTSLIPIAVEKRISAPNPYLGNIYRLN
jgi:hypothetical protein